MPYFPDSTLVGTTIRVGWLAEDQPFTKGKVHPEFLAKLEILYRHRVSKTRGWHSCQFCPVPLYGLPIEFEGKTHWLGDAEIHVVTSDGHVFAAPDLIYHYIVTHEYLPPVRFIEAVMMTVR